MNQSSKFRGFVAFLAILAGSALVALPAMTSAHVAPVANPSVQPASLAPSVKAPSVINLQPVVIVASSKRTRKPATVSTQSPGPRLRVLEQGGRPGGQFVLAF